MKQKEFKQHLQFLFNKSVKGVFNNYKKVFPENHVPAPNEFLTNDLNYSCAVGQLLPKSRLAKQVYIELEFGMPDDLILFKQEHKKFVYSEKEYLRFVNDNSPHWIDNQEFLEKENIKSLKNNNKILSEIDKNLRLTECSDKQLRELGGFLNQLMEVHDNEPYNYWKELYAQMAQDYKLEMPKVNVIKEVYAKE